MRQGFNTSDDKWLDDVIEKIGPGGNFIGEKTTRTGARSGEWYLTDFGMHDTFGVWDQAGRPQLLDEARAEVERFALSENNTILNIRVIVW